MNQAIPKSLAIAGRSTNCLIDPDGISQVVMTDRFKSVANLLHQRHSSRNVQITEVVIVWDASRKASRPPQVR
jgi:hypothetical protein